MRRLEDSLDVINIRMERTWAEMELRNEQKQREEAKIEASKTSWFSGWWSSSKKSSDEDEEAQGSVGGFSLKKLKEGMTEKDKEELFKAIGYQEDALQAAAGGFPKRFVAHVWAFHLDHLVVAVRDQELKSRVLTLDLTNVQCDVAQRPSARNYFKLNMSMERLSVTGFKGEGSRAPPTIVDTIVGDHGHCDLLSIEVRNLLPFESHKPILKKITQKTQPVPRIAVNQNQTTFC